jgi:hypothetical protein
MALKDQIRHMIDRVPLARNLLVKNRTFQVERALIRGQHRSDSSHPSIIHFSVNKAATQYVKDILCLCALQADLTNVHLHEYAFASDFPYLSGLSRAEMEKYHHVFRPKGYLYSAFGAMIQGIPNLDQYHVILMVRDPRDVLTSSFFSKAYSHHVPKDPSKASRFLDERDYAKRVGIDEYVLAQCKQVSELYQTYLDTLVYPHQPYITKYEEMIMDFPGWLDKTLDFCQLEIASQLRQELINEASQPSESEDLNRHKRQAKPGDYRRKLAPDTIKQLNTSLQDILQAFQYSVS